MFCLMGIFLRRYKYRAAFENSSLVGKLGNSFPMDGNFIAIVRLLRDYFVMIIRKTCLEDYNIKTLSLSVVMARASAIKTLD